jgi:coenzyme F420-0:L-glutamate ligase/coenzyme F420-1:gamma-L-glutamate ligase
MAASSVTLTALPGVKLIEPGDDLAAILGDALEAAGLRPQASDVLVVAQKVFSKAENRYVELASVAPSPRAVALAAEIDKDPRLVEVILGESDEVVRQRKGVIIVAHRLGFVMANAGVDQSNVAPSGGSERALLLPENPDRSCAELQRRLAERFGVEIAIVMNDSFGRAWRNGVVGIAIGVAGLPALRNLVGEPDLFGRQLRVTEVAFADEIAAAASLLMGQAAEGRPVVLVRGLAWREPATGIGALLRPKAMDLFR